MSIGVAIVVAVLALAIMFALSTAAFANNR